MWIADKLAYRGEENFVRAYEGSTLVWEKIPSNKIYYTSTDGQVVTPSVTSYGSETYVWHTRIVSNTYSGGRGVITFDGEVTNIPDAAFSQCTKLSSIILPGGITYIGSFAVEGCENLTSINIPSGVTVLNSYTFSWCLKLNSIVIPSSVTSINDLAFAGCENLTSINIPEGITRLAVAVFDDCVKLTSIVIPSSVTLIEYESFLRCRRLSKIVVNAVNPPAMTLSPYTHTYNQFSDCPSNLQIKVPAGSVQAYKTATGWSDYASKIVSQ